jgi:hypothetical protein
MASIHYTTYRANGGSVRGRTESPATTRYPTGSSFSATVSSLAQSNTINQNLKNISSLSDKKTSQLERGNLNVESTNSYDYIINTQENNNTKNYELRTPPTNTRRSSLKLNLMQPTVSPNNSSSNNSILNHNCTTSLISKISNQHDTSKNNTSSFTVNKNSENKNNKYKNSLNKPIDKSLIRLNLNDDLYDANCFKTNKKLSLSSHYQNQSNGSELNGLFPAAASSSTSFLTKSNLFSSSSSQPLQTPYYSDQYSKLSIATVIANDMADLEGKGIVGLKNLGNTVIIFIIIL